MLLKLFRGLMVIGLVLGAKSSCIAALENFEEHDIDYIAEHVPEAAMNNRFLTLPVWIPSPINKNQKLGLVQVNYNDIDADVISLKGPALGLGFRYGLSNHWALHFFGFYDSFNFYGQPENRDMNPLFLSSLPLDLPATAHFNNLRGHYAHKGLGIAFSWQPQTASERKTSTVWTFGLLRNRVDLDYYKIDYLILNEGSAGATGVLNHSATYDYITPFLGTEWIIPRNKWIFTPRWTAALPLPRRAWEGKLEGPGFSVSGDTKSAGHGTHMGDAMAGFGFGVTYHPLNITWDAGATVNQYLLEGKLHKGIDSTLLISVSWLFGIKSQS